MMFRPAVRKIALSLVPIAVLSVLGYLAVHSPIVESGLQVPKNGVVLDAQTRQPLAGVYVVARWLEQSSEDPFGAPGRTSGQCLFRAVVRTDEHGHYAIPAADFTVAADRTLAPRKYFWDASAYAPGYSIVDAATRHPALGSSPKPATQELEPILLAADQSAPEQRVAELADTLSRFSCRPYAPGPVPVAEPVHAEAYAAACLPEPNAAARSLGRLRDDGAQDSGDAAQEPCALFRQASANR